MKKFSDLMLELSLGAAGSFAADAHTGQHRKTSGAPYIVHPTAVMRLLQKVGVKDKNILVAAFLHDTVEDSSTSYNDLKSKFNKEVADLVKEVTSNSKELKIVGKPKYLAMKMIKMTDGALLIKLADRLHNTEDLDSMPEEKSKSYAVQTEYIFQELNDKRRLSRQHKKLIKQIKKQINKYLR